MSGDTTTAIVTDSTGDIAPAMAAERGITVVPLSVTFGSETLLDGELTQEEFFARMAKAPQLPTTSQPSVGAFVEAYARALEAASSVVSIHISNHLSGTIESAEQFPGKVHVFDSLNLSWGTSLQIMEAVRMRDDGLGPCAILERLEQVRAKVQLIVGLDSLDNLARGGRIGRVSAFLGSMLNLKVTLTVDPNGEFQPVARNRGERAALQHTLEWVAEKLGPSQRGAFAVGHALERDRADRIASEIRERFDVDSLVIYEAGSAICTHTGTGWGVAVPLPTSRRPVGAAGP